MWASSGTSDSATDPSDPSCSRARSLSRNPDRARFDNHYIEHWSLWRDVVIVARTVANMLLGR